MSAQASDAEVQQPIPIIIISWFWKLLKPVVGLFIDCKNNQYFYQNIH